MKLENKHALLSIIGIGLWIFAFSVLYGNELGDIATRFVSVALFALGILPIIIAFSIGNESIKKQKGGD